MCNRSRNKSFSINTITTATCESDDPSLHPQSKKRRINPNAPVDAQLVLEATKYSENGYFKYLEYFPNRSELEAKRHAIGFEFRLPSITEDLNCF
jgi:hypothetical protein